MFRRMTRLFAVVVTLTFLIGACGKFNPSGPSDVLTVSFTCDALTAKVGTAVRCTWDASTSAAKVKIEPEPGSGLASGGSRLLPVKAIGPNTYVLTATVAGQVPAIQTVTLTGTP